MLCESRTTLSKMKHAEHGTHGIPPMQSRPPQYGTNELGYGTTYTLINRWRGVLLCQLSKCILLQLLVGTDAEAIGLLLQRHEEVGRLGERLLRRLEVLVVGDLYPE